MLAWWSLTPTPECSSIITQHQLARDGRGGFSSPNGGMFVLTKRETHFCNRRRVSFCETSHVSLHALTAQSTHTHLNPGLHGDCFSAHVNLPPASVSRFVRRVKKKKKRERRKKSTITYSWPHDYFHFLQRSLGTIKTTGKKKREQTVPNFFVL